MRCDPGVVTAKRFLFLQGHPTLFCWRLGRALAAEGHHVGKVRLSAAHLLNAVRMTGKNLYFYVEFIAMKLKVLGVNFAKLTNIIDDMVTLLGKEPIDDNMKKEYDTSKIDKSEDEIKKLRDEEGLPRYRARESGYGPRLPLLRREEVEQ